ncbi:MAG TPA: hypothetical protein VF470_04935, partial [Sphingomicrobium sp.]
MIDRIRIALAGAAMLVACSGDSTAPSQQADAEAAAQRFFQLADSVWRTGGNPDTYAAIGWILRTGGR